MANFNSSVTAFFGGDTTGLQRAISSAETMVGAFQRTLSTLGLGIGAAAVVGFFKTVVDHAGKIQDLSDRLSVSTDALQAFNASAEEAGATTEQAALAWQNAKKAIDELGAGTPAVVASFNALGLTVEDFIGLNLEQSLDKIAQGYAKNKNEAGAYAAISDILGSKSAPKLNAVLLAMGEETLPALIARMKEAGQVIEQRTF